MFREKECIAMLLAGGEGSRLGVLTKDRAKPAVPFGGKYRIIDFTLSNCVNSGIDTVGVLTQYQPLELSDYIGNGQPWDLDRFEGGIHVLPPYQRRRGADWYQGTANAISQNIPFIERYCPEYVVILSGDHIYKMDYARMLNFHKNMNADCTIAVINVSLEDASRFGIMNTDEDGQIYEFEEKPKKPKSTKASMGVYIFSWLKLRAYLELDEQDKSSAKDFGKNIIPAMLKAKERMFAFPFKGYWKDVGTIDSLWEANMDLLDKKTSILMQEPNWKIYARSPVEPPHYICVGSKVSNSMIAEGCTIEGDISSSILFHGVRIERGAVVRDSIIMPGSCILEGATVNNTIIAEDVVIGKDAVVGESIVGNSNHAQSITVIGNDVTVGAGAHVGACEMIDTDIMEVQ